MPREPFQTATIGELQRQPGGMWLWLECPRCRHRAPVPLAPFVIRWGANASSDRLRRNTRCSRCGHTGALTQMRSHCGKPGGDSDDLVEVFPASHIPPTWTANHVQESSNVTQIR